MLIRSGVGSLFDLLCAIAQVIVPAGPEEALHAGADAGFGERKRTLKLNPSADRLRGEDAPGHRSGDRCATLAQRPLCISVTDDRLFCAYRPFISGCTGRPCGRTPPPTLCW